MLSDADIVCFAATRNPDAARTFYGQVLGLTLIEDSPFALAFDANGTMLRIQKVQVHTPAKHTTLGWTVRNIHESIETLMRSGVRFERYEGLPQDEAGIWKSPSGALVAWFLDPDGNGLSLTQWPPQHSPTPSMRP